MSDLTLTKTRLFEGVWEGILTRADGGSETPKVQVTHLAQELEGVTLAASPNLKGTWVLKVPIPAESIADGIQTNVISNGETGTAIGDFSLVAGEALAHDLRAEVSLLREELDLLKRAFRRHCIETM